MTVVSKLKSFSILTKMLALVGTLLLGQLFLGGLSYYSMQTMGDHLEHVNKNDLPAIVFLAEINLKFTEKSVLLEQAFRFGNEVAMGNSQATLPFQNSRKKFSLLSKDIEILYTSGAEKLGSYSALRLKDNNASLSPINTQLNLLEKEIEQQNYIANKLFKLLAVGRIEKAKSYEPLIVENQNNLHKSLTNLTVTVLDSVTVSSIEAEENKSIALEYDFLVLLISVFSGGLLAFFITRSILHPARIAIDIAKDITEGNYTIDIGEPRNDELGRLLQAMEFMANTLEQQTKSLKEQSSTLQLTNKELKKNADDLSDQKFALDQHAIVAITNVKGDITFANKKFEEISGYSQEELIGQNHRLLKSGEHNDTLFRDMFLTISQGKVWHGDLCNKAKDGSHYWVNTSIIPLMKNGKPESYIAIRSDITQRKLLESENLKVAQFAMENPGLVIKLSQKNEIVFANPSAIASLKCKQIGLGDLAPKEWLPAIKKTFESKEMFQFEENFDDSIKLLTIKHIDDKDGMSVNIYGSDITNLKQVEADLIKSKMSAEQAAIAKSEFLASMSHEIRTPMNGVLGMLGLLLETNLEDDQKRKASIAKTSADSLLSIINNILDFSKIEAGKLEIEILDFNLKDYLGDFAESMALGAHQKGLELILDITDIEHSKVKGDAGRLRQILTNLVGNAIKFTETGEIIIRASLKRVVGDSFFLICSIKDSGLGIPQNKLSTLFDSFTQVDASTTREYGGTGLGLAIVKQLCELMQGKLTVSSDVGIGSCFEFSIPIKLSEDSVKLVAPVDINNIPILIVDDNASQRHTLKSQLTFWGALITEASSGSEALQILNNTANDRSNNCIFAMVFIDQKMPSMDGIALATHIRQNSAFDRTPLVLMTEMNSKNSSSHYLNLGFSDHFPKPITSQDLFQVLPLAINGESASDRAVNNHTTSSRKEHSQEDAPTKDIRILLVEDNQVNQEVALNILETLGMSADIVSDGLEAISALQQRQKIEPYELILMDCQMPNMDGYTATQCIRQGKAGHQFCKTPIIAMTANAMSGDRQKCISAGMSDYLSKPISPEKLEAKIHHWVFDSGSILNEIDDEEENEKEGENATIDQQEISDILLWDRDAMLSRLGKKPERLSRIIKLFISSMPERVEMLVEAIKAEDCKTIEMESHGIKGAAGNLGGLRVQHITQKIETAAKNKETEYISSLLPTLTQNFDDLIARIEQE